MARHVARGHAISIHALREERDQRGLYQLPKLRHISIHALREERDSSGKWLFFYAGNDFNPRAPRGARPQRAVPHRLTRYISIHALREERDSLAAKMPSSMLLFQSTRSARSATHEGPTGQYQF